ARRAAVEGLRIAGKTGTAQTASGGSYARSYRASFVGFFPVEAPEVALLVILDQPTNGYYGGSVAAPIFGAVARRWIGTFPSIAAARARRGACARRGRDAGRARRGPPPRQRLPRPRGRRRPVGARRRPGPRPRRAGRRPPRRPTRRRSRRRARPPARRARWSGH